MEDQLVGVLRSHRITPRGANKTTQFSLVYWVEVLAPAKVNVTILCRAKMPQNIELNKEMMLDALDKIEERCNKALLKIEN